MAKPFPFQCPKCNHCTDLLHTNEQIMIEQRRCPFCNLEVVIFFSGTRVEVTEAVTLQLRDRTAVNMYPLQVACSHCSCDHEIDFNACRLLYRHFNIQARLWTCETVSCDAIVLLGITNFSRAGYQQAVAIVEVPGRCKRAMAELEYSAFLAAQAQILAHAAEMTSDGTMKLDLGAAGMELLKSYHSGDFGPNRFEQFLQDLHKLDRLPNPKGEFKEGWS